MKEQLRKDDDACESFSVRFDELSYTVGLVQLHVFIKIVFEYTSSSFCH